MTHLSPYSTSKALLSQHYNKVQYNNECGALLHYLFLHFLYSYKNFVTPKEDHHFQWTPYKLKWAYVCMIV